MNEKLTFDYSQTIRDHFFIKEMSLLWFMINFC